MPLRYFYSDSLTALFPVMHAALREERRAIPPQRTQAIIVGNLDTEAWITRRILAEDGVLMGVSFPFLESAISSFSERLWSALPPRASESWFLPPAKSKGLPRAISAVELEIMLLGILNAPEYQDLLGDLGYSARPLAASQLTALAGRLTDELRESILHCPQLLHDIAQARVKADCAGKKLWLAVYETMKRTSRPFTAFDPGLAEWIAAQPVTESANSETLYLFGMPILSEYHARALCAIAKHQTVSLYMTDLSHYQQSENILLSSAGKKAAAFTRLLESACVRYGTDFSATAVTSRPIPERCYSLYSLPGAWRAAELISDEFHQLLLDRKELYQNDIAVALTNPSAQYAAFERALAMRHMTAFSRERFYEVPHSLAELWQIISDAATNGLNRPLIIRYALNPLVSGREAQRKELIPLWLAALEKSHGYRDDYPEPQSIFGIESALRRLDRGILIGNTTDPRTPAARLLRLADSQPFALGLHGFFGGILQARQRLTGLTGAELAGAMLALQRDITGTGEATKTLAEWFEQIKFAPGFSGLALAHMVKLLRRHLPGKSLAQQTGREGITFCSLGASSFTQDTLLLFDLNEDADRHDSPTEHIFPEITDSVTRFTGSEQLATQLATALAGNCRHVIFAYSSLEPATGAEKYPSQVLAALPLAAAQVGRTEGPQRNFPTTILARTELHPPVAADADRRTIWLLGQSGRTASLSQYALPKIRTVEKSSAAHQVRDLLAFMENPARYRLRQYLPPDPEIVSFGRDEPRIAVSSDARLRFCEEYLESSLLDASGTQATDPLEFIRMKQLRAEYAPEGFDQASRLLQQADNRKRLFQLAEQICSDLNLIEYILHPGISHPFSIQETARLKRHYFPAPVILGQKITGSLGTMLQTSEGKTHRLQSAIYSDRNASLVALHLAICLLTVSGLSAEESEIALADFATKTQSKDPIGALAFTTRAGLRVPDAAYAKDYLDKFISRLNSTDVIWYDHFLIREPKIAEWAELPTEEILQKFSRQQEKGMPADLQRLQSYFALEPDFRSLDFFDAFIRPVARLDEELNATEKKSLAGNTKTRNRRRETP